MLSGTAGRAVLRLPDDLCVVDGLSLCDQAAAALAVVTHRGRDVGVISADELADAPRGSLIKQVLRRELVELEPTADMSCTLRRYRERAWASLFRRHPGRVADETEADRGGSGRTGRGTRCASSAEHQRRAAASEKNPVRRAALLLAAEVLDTVAEEAVEEPTRTGSPMTVSRPARGGGPDGP